MDINRPVSSGTQASGKFNTVPLPIQKTPKFKGIKDGQATQIFNSNGELVSIWGRNVELAFDKVFLGTTKKTDKKSTHDAQEKLTRERLDILTKPLKNLTQQVDRILNFPQNIDKNKTFVKVNRIEKTSQEDTEAYLSYEIEACQSGTDLLRLKEEVRRLEREGRLSRTIIDSLNDKIRSQMKFLVEGMSSILTCSYSDDPEKCFEETREKCKAVEDLYTAACDIDENLARDHRPAFRDMMVKTFTDDVKEITKICLERNNLQENRKLSDDMESLRKETVNVFLQKVSTHDEKYTKEVRSKVEKRLNRLKAQRDEIPDLINVMDGAVNKATELIKKEAGYLLRKNELEQRLSNFEEKHEKAIILRPWCRLRIHQTKHKMSKVDKRAEKTAKKLPAHQALYCTAYRDLKNTLEKFGWSIEGTEDGLYTLPHDTQKRMEERPLYPGSSPTRIPPHPEAVLATARDKSKNIDRPWVDLQEVSPSVMKEMNLQLLSTESFNRACCYSLIGQPLQIQPVGLTRARMKVLEGKLKQLQASLIKPVTDGSLSVSHDTHSQLVKLQAAFGLAMHQRTEDITSEQLMKAHALRIRKKEPLPDLVSGHRSSHQSTVTLVPPIPVDNTATWQQPDLIPAEDRLTTFSSEQSPSASHLDDGDDFDDYDDDDDDFNDYDDGELPSYYSKTPISDLAQQELKANVAAFQEQNSEHKDAIDDLHQKYLSWLNFPYKNDGKEEYLDYIESLPGFNAACMRVCGGTTNGMPPYDVLIEEIQKLFSPPSASAE